jgi:hypothetical protein
MKKKLSILLICLLTVTAALQAANKTIKGDGKVNTHTISISEYNQIEIAGQMTFEYEQSTAAPFLSITVDDNVFEYIKAEVKGNKLSIGPKSEREDGMGDSYNLQPTVYKVKSNSRELVKLNKAGSGAFLVGSPLKINDLDVSLAGSGSVVFQKEVTGSNLKASVAGSGSLEALDGVHVENSSISLAGSGKVKLTKQISGDNLKLSVAGSGNLDVNNINVKSFNGNMASSGNAKIAGSAIEASYNLAGSGTFKAYDLKADKVKANLTGSGRIEVYASSELNASTMGSGSILYKGSPSKVSENSVGSSSVKATGN